MPDTPAPDALALAELRNRCTKWMNNHRPRRTGQEALARLAALPEAGEALDVYGEGALIARLESEVAALLGKPAAVFFHKGVAAQLAALAVWTKGAREALVALPRQSHIELDEQQAHERLLGVRGLRLAGEGDAPFTVDALEALREKPAVVVVELPLRRAAYRLLEWEQLEAISAWCRANGVPLHADGARLWESAPHYGRTLAEICALADSVYVSFYKGLGGLAGCVLAGSGEFLAQVGPWKSRLAGNVSTVFPYVLATFEGLRTQLPRMGAYRERARALAARLVAEPGWHVLPEPPQVNAFQLHLPGRPEALRAALLEVARESRFWLGAACVASVLPGHGMLEVSIGDAADEWGDEELVARLRDVVAGAANAGSGLKT
jgi:threonine aldolase